MPIRATIAALAFAALLTTPAGAQTPSETGTGGGPSSTFYAPNTSAVGRVMPPSRGSAPDADASATARTPREKQADNIMRGICIGCGAQ